MKQFQFDYSDSETLNKKLSEFKEWCDSGNGAKKIFQIYSEELEPECIREVCDIIEKMFPNTLYMGCSTSGNIIDCQLSGRITIVCTVFELPSTQVQLYQYDLSKQSVDDITKTIVKETESNPWVKAMEMFFTIPEQSSTLFCVCL